MAKATPPFKRNKAHTIYKLADGTRVPGTTTITSQLDKPALVSWANRLGLQGIDALQYRDSMAGVGTLAHAMVLSEMSGEPLTEDIDEYSKKEISLAENSMIKFYNWQKAHAYEPIYSERPLVSEIHRYGGTLDSYGILDGKHNLVDIKTGKAIYPEMVYQLAAYWQLLLERGYEVDEVRILRIGRDESEGFEERVFRRLDKAWEVFWHLLQIYYLKKEV